MYRITVFDENGERDLDLLESSFPFNFESNDIAQLNDSTASWSYTISLPRTERNEKVLGHAGMPFVSALTPYRRVSCNVYADGMRIIHAGVLVIDTTTKTEYKTQILAGTANVFDLMKAIDFKNWSRATQVTLPGTSLPANTTPASGINHSYPMPTKIAVSGNTPQMQTKEDDFYMYATPLLRVGAAANMGVLKNLMTEIGYSFVTDTPDSILDALWLSMATRKKSQNGNVMWRSSDSNIGIDNIITNNGKSRRGKTRISCTFTSRNDFYDTHHSRVSLASAFSSFLSAGGSCYLVIWDQRYQPGEATPEIARLSANNFSVSGNNLVASVTIDGSAEYLQFRSFGGTSETQWQGYDGSGFYTYTGMHISSYKWRVETLVADDSDTAYSGQSMKLEPNVGIANGMDFFKLLSQVFGWTVKVEADTKTVIAHTFAYIVGRKQYAQDWTSRVDMGEDTEADFDFGSYAQENIIKLQENKLGGYQDTGSFTIDNVNLAPSKNLLDIKACSGRADRIEQWERKDDGSYEWKDGSAPHLINWANAGDAISHVTPSDILANYSQLISVLQEVVLVKIKMMLTPLDIYNFDQFTPIYLKQFGRYYYVNKIKDWEVGKLCTVELLQLTF